jgi:hypothetical protein
MTVHKLFLEEFDAVDYNLIALHCTLESYKLAFFLNQKLPILLSKSKEDVEVKHKGNDVWFSKYTFFDKNNQVNWSLIENKSVFSLEQENRNNTLFIEINEKIENKIYLLPEFKKVDFFLKIEDSEQVIDNKKIIQEVQKIPKISALYEVEIQKVKSKNNLIF